MRTAKSHETDAPDAAPKRRVGTGGNRRDALGRTLQRAAGNWAYAGWLQAQREPGAGEPLDAVAERLDVPLAETPNFIVSDAVEAVGPEQMRKQVFLAVLHTRVCEVAETELAGTGRSTDGCPYLDTWFDYYASRDPGHIELVVRRYAPASRSARSAAAYIDIITERVRQGVRQWAQTGEVSGVPADPEDAEGVALDVEKAPPQTSTGRAEASDEKPMVQRKTGVDTDPPPSGQAAQRIQARIGDGRPLPAGVRSRMEGILGGHFSGVRIHTAPPAAELARQLRARAFTVGRDVAFAPNEFVPGTVSGDLLLAHELAHVEQQQQAVSAPPSDGSTEVEQVLEDDADRTAAGAVAALWGRATEWVRETARRARPRLRSGLRVQRCSIDYSVEDRARLIRRELSKDPDEMNPDRIVLFFENLTPDEVDRLKKVYEEEYSESRGGRSLLDDLQFGMLGPGRTTGLLGSTGRFESRNADELYEAYEALGDKVERQDGPTPDAGNGIVADPPDREVLPGVSVTYRLQKQPSLPAATAIQWIVRNDPGVADEHALVSEFVLGPSQEEWEDATWDYPGRHQVICMVRFGTGTDSLVHFYAFEQVVREVRDIARDEFSEALNEQSRGVRQAQAEFEKVANQVRKAATETNINERLVRAFGEALGTVVEVESHLQSGSEIPDVLATRAVSTMQAFFHALRAETEPFDETEERDYGQGGGTYTATVNPYLSPDMYRYYRRRVETDRVGWARKLEVFYTVTQKMDAYISTRLREAGRVEEAEMLDYAGRLSTETGMLHAKHQDTQRVRAVFYPERQRLENQGTAESPSYDLQEVHLYFYIYREDGEWHLTELTTPDDPIVSSEEGGTESTPPDELFEELNTRLRFPKGVLFWELPNGGRFSLRTTEPWSLSDWLTAIGLGLAAAALVVGTAGLGTPATILIVGSGIVGAAAAGADIYERADVGRLTSRSVVINVASIVASLASAGTAGLGRIAVTGALRTGQYARLAVLADRYFLPVAATAALGDLVTVAAFAESMIHQYETIQQSDLPEDQKEVAVRRLLQASLLTGAVTLLAFRGQVRDLRRGRTLFLDTTLADDVIARPILRPEDLLAYARRNGVEAQMEHLLTMEGVSDDFMMRVRADLTAAIDAPNIRDDDVKKVIGDLAEARNRSDDQIRSGMEEALAELRAANRVNLTASELPQRMYIGARQANEPFDLSDEVSVTISPVSEADLLYMQGGRVMLEEVKNTGKALRLKLQSTPNQLQNMSAWESAAAPDLPRGTRVRIEREHGWTEIFGPIGDGQWTLKSLIDEGIPLSIGPYDLTIGQMRTLNDAAFKRVQSLNRSLHGEFFQSIPTLRDAERVLDITFLP